MQAALKSETIPLPGSAHTAWQEVGLVDGDLIAIDYAKVAEGYGVKAYTVRTVQELKDALRDAKKQEISTLINIKVLPKTMTSGYGAWWHVGISEDDDNDRIKESVTERQLKLNNARMY